MDILSEGEKILKRKQATGLLVMGVEKKSPAAEGGLIVGDILVGVDGSQIHHHDDLFAYLTGDLIGKSTPFDVLRGGQLTTINIKVGER